MFTFFRSRDGLRSRQPPAIHYLFISQVQFINWIPINIWGFSDSNGPFSSLSLEKSTDIHLLILRITWRPNLSLDQASHFANPIAIQLVFFTIVRLFAFAPLCREATLDFMPHFSALGHAKSSPIPRIGHKHVGRQYSCVVVARSALLIV